MTTALTDSRYRYRIFAMVFFIALINYVDRGALSFAANDISREFNFNKAQLGAVLGYFGFGYLFGSLCGGFLADRVGTKKVWLIAGALWSLLEIATAWAGELGVALFGGSAIMGFAALRIMFGFAEGPAYALMNKTIANWAPRKERGFSLGIGLLSTQVGSLLTAPLAVGLLLLTDDWRSMFMLLGLFSLIAILLFARFFTDTPQEHPQVNAAELAAISADQDADSQKSRLPWWAFFTNRTLVFNALGYFSFLYVTFVLVTWGPKYLQDTFNYDLHSLWYVAMIPWSGACFLLIPFMSTPTEIILLMTLGNALNALVNNVYWSVVIDVTPKASVGTYSGMTLAITNIASITAPMLSGWLAQHHGYGAMFLATAAVSFCSMLCMTLLQPERKIGADSTLPNHSGIRHVAQ